MIKLIQLSYKVKNNIKNNDKSILQKEDPYNRLCKLFKREKWNQKRKTPKMLDKEQQPQQVSQWRFE